jgi:hypothetical protein
VGYDFYQRENRFMGFTLGAHLLDATTGISAAFFIDGTPVTGDNRRDASTGGLIPVPNLGFYGSYLLGNKWRLDGRIDWFGISVGEWDGTLVTADLQFVYLINESWRVGAGIQYFTIDVTYTTDQWLGALDYQYFGPRLEVGFAF